MEPNPLIPFLKPQGVAIVGASKDPTKLGYGLARNLTLCGYPGAIHFVNPKGGQLFNREIYPSLNAVPDPVDLAVLLTPPAFVPQTLQECGERGIRAAIIASGGFKETGPEGAALEAECVNVARQYGIRLIGPNCIGTIDTHVPLDTTFLQPPGPSRGEVAFISHSGAICAAVIDWVRGQGIGLSALVSLGNQADVTEADMLQLVAEDPHTSVLTLYIEGISSGRRFLDAARRVVRQKPVLALKVGRFESGQKAAASHTGALAGSESAVDAAFAQAGVIRANTTEELFQWARALAWSPLPGGRNAAVLTNAGGPGVTAADALELNGLRLAHLLPETEQALKTVLPPAASVHNPVDMLASASPDHYAQCLQILLADPGVDQVMVITPPPPMYSTGGIAKALIPIIQRTEKPVIIALMGDRLIQEAVEHFRAARIPEYRFPEWAASAMGVLSQRADFLAARSEILPRPLGCDESKARQAVANENQIGGLSQETAVKLFEAYGIPVLKLELAETAEQAVEIGRRSGFPVVLKVASPDITHKSDVGGVLLNLKDEQAVYDGFQKVILNARNGLPQAAIQGVHVQRMLPAGQETIVGMVRDPQFGAMVMFGSGGVEVEGLKDVAFALAPLTGLDLERMLEKTWAGRKLRGFRHLPPADREAVCDVINRLAHLAIDFPELAEIEINPLRVLEAGQGAYAIDVRGRISR